MVSTGQRSVAAVSRFTPSAWGGWFTALLLLLCVVATDPRLEMGLHDDWSYIFSAKQLACTGHMQYNGWAAFPLGWQMYAGALVVKLFGFSFTAVRCVNITLGCLAAPLIFAIGLRFGLRPGNAFAGTFAFILSPLFLPLATSFMSDLPSLLCILLCLYGCLQAVQASTQRAAAGWLIAAALGNVAGGTVRQIAWLGVLVMVPSATLYLRKQRFVLLSGMLVWAVSILLIAVTLHWFNRQPFVAHEALIALPMSMVGLRFLLKFGVKSACTLGLLLSPVLLGVAFGLPPEAQRGKRRLAWLVATMVLLVTAASLLHPGLRWMSLLVGDYLTAKGMLDLPWIIGPAPDVISPAVQAAIAAFVASACAAGLFALWTHRRGLAEQISAHDTFVVLIGPFSMAYLLLVITRSAIFDRYFFPLQFFLILLILLAFQRVTKRDLPAIWMAPALVMMLYAIAGTHDLFASSRARLAAANELRAAGVPRISFRAGFEYDAWTQLEATGYVNEPRMQRPVGAYHPWTPPAGVANACVPWFSSYTPSIHPEYVLSSVAGLCYPLSPLPAVQYNTWLPPHAHSIYIEQVH